MRRRAAAAASSSRTARSSPRRSSSIGSGSPFTIDSKNTLRSWYVANVSLAQARMSFSSSARRAYGSPNSLGDLALQALRERRARARRRDRDRDRAVAHDGGHDEVAERRHVDDVHEHRAALRLAEHLHVQVGVRGRREHQQRAVEIARLEARRCQHERALRRELGDRGLGLGRHDDHACVAASSPSIFSSPTGPAPMTRHARSRTFMKVGKNVRLEQVARARGVAVIQLHGDRRRDERPRPAR